MLDLAKNGLGFFNNVLCCVVLCCVVLCCVVLCCVALSSMRLQNKTNKKHGILGKGTRKASFCEMFRFAQHDDDSAGGQT